MAELTPSERLQPCLLDRLTDDEPKARKESRDRRVISMRRYRDAVLRDLGWLMNTGALPHGDPIYEFERAATSVLNFGTHDLSGRTAEGTDSMVLEREMLQAILRFEPRILPESLKVRAVAAAGRMDQNAISFEITGDLWAQPMPDQMYIKTEVDLETGACEVKMEGVG